MVKPVKKLAWVFPALGKPAAAPAKANPAPAPVKPAKDSKQVPAAAKKPAPAPQPAAKPAAAPPKPAKPAPLKADITKAGPQDPDYSLIGYGNPPRHPQTGQELAPYGPGRAPELFHKNGEVTGKPLWRYEGSEHWQSNPLSAMHAWMAVFATYFPKEAKMLAEENRRLIAEEERAAALALLEEENSLLA